MRDNRKPWLIRRIVFLGVAAMVMVGAACSDDDETADDSATTTVAPETTAAPTTAAAPAAPNTAEPDLRDLDVAAAAMLSEAREDFLLTCGAESPELDQERCVLIWNCAVNEVGVAVAADKAQSATLDQALDSCSTTVP